jgi:hypothetical protein
VGKATVKDIFLIIMMVLMGCSVVGVMAFLFHHIKVDKKNLVLNNLQRKKEVLENEIQEFEKKKEDLLIENFEAENRIYDKIIKGGLYV